jgi:pseudaminic acid synthase
VIKPLIVAELGANHMGSFERAKQILDCAGKAGAGAFKMQVWSEDTMCIDPTYVIDHGAWKGVRMVDLYRDCYTPWDWLPKLFDAAYARDMEPFASVFDEDAVDYLEGLNSQLYKIASYELVDLKLLRRVAATGKRVILSTGAATRDEIALAVAQFPRASDVTLLHCVSEYPSRPDSANLATMRDMGERFGCDFGLSDHSLGVGVAVAAAAMGASVIEKHLALRRSDGGPDGGFSMEPEEFAVMCHAARQAAVAQGDITYVHKPSRLRRSLWVGRDVTAGSALAACDIRSARPALGALPRDLDAFIGRPAARDIAAGTPLTWDLVTASSSQALEK